ncbi:glucose-6-phosphate isomerase [Vulgatibacter incomptus]|uniref:Glucose-6-phosphate isomerase n=1 Tax=Vulgatibacter incomptus TaxID=1391653 RepID=A0A0K1PA46_9BACT|nr:glucose-6-phosphate isomerase [Vulgatibacter incomptus]AKU90390.1 Glucose-6-phosphate isomerase [Vulgatibacter incomptus]
MPSSRLVLDASLALEGQIGVHGLSAGDFTSLEEAAESAHRKLWELRGSGALGFWSLPDDAAIRDPALELGEELARRFENVVVLGIGGSSLGAKAVISALGDRFGDLLPRSRRSGARVFFPDNSDPATFTALLERLDLGSTCFLVITKSGSTAETLSQLLVVRERLGSSKLIQQTVAITDPEEGPLRRIVREEGWRSLPIPPSVGGRFSVLTAAGLVPIAAAGVDARSLCKGAAEMRERCEAPSLRKNPAYLLGGIHRLFDRRGRNIHVLFPYADALRDVGDWFVQLWAESLGKSETVGPTPLRAVGATDQHSLLQLLAQGPQDKLVSFIGVEEPATDLEIPRAWTEHEAFAYLGGKTLGRLLDAERQGTAAALAEGGRPSVTIRLPRVDARSVGELLFLWEAATAFAGFLYGVDPFNQPGVEASKQLTQALLGRPGSEAHAKRLAARPSPDPAFVLD